MPPDSQTAALGPIGEGSSLSHQVPLPRAPVRRAYFAPFLRTMARALLPVTLRRRALRFLLALDVAPTPRLHLGLAQNLPDLEACYALVQASNSARVVGRRQRLLHLTVWNAMPGTMTFFVKFDGVVVGTVTLIRDSELGLPADAQFSLGGHRARSQALYELAALAVRSDFRYTYGFVLFPLLHACFLHLREQSDATLLSVVMPNRSGLFEDLLGFQRLNRMDAAGVIKAVLVEGSVDQCAVRMRDLYKDAPDHRNLHRYLFESRLANNTTPAPRYRVARPSVMSPAMLDHFFNQRSDLFNRLSDAALIALHRAYGSAAYAGVLPNLNGPRPTSFRRHPRHEVHMAGTIDLQGGPGRSTVALTIVEVSSAGFLAHTTRPLPKESYGAVQIALGPRDQSSGNAVMVSGEADVNNDLGTSIYTYGFRLTESDLAWQKMVAALSAASTDEQLALATQFLPVDAPE